MIVAGVAMVQSGSADELTHPELLAQLDRLKSVAWALPAVEHRMLARLAVEASPAALGGASLADVLCSRLRISKTEAHRRLTDAELLGPRTALTGEPLPPKLPTVAAAQQRGDIGPEHLKVITTFFDDLPAHVDYQTREAAEADLGCIATGLGPTQFGKAAARLAALIDQDGPEPSDADRARKRYFTIEPQGRDGLSKCHGLLDPEARATLEAVQAKWAAPGMCNPADQSPCVSGTPSQDAIDNDTRSPGQRNHDTLTAMGRSVLASGQLGRLNGLACTMIVSTTLKELESGRGHAITAGGTLLPMSTVIRLASMSYHYLSVFDQHTSMPLYLGRSKRIATPAQRIVLHAKDRGCTHPGCTVPGYGCQVHHAEKDWADGGLTNIDDLTLACKPHNLLVETGGWKTRKRKDGTTEWIPPPHLDSGQTRVNHYHHPERYLIDPDGDAA
ncbi:HNH endonuclease signature motif containing protein [Mycobacterium sp.]|uniref:HNH endonuclease signature motif containing protein n=1 Tax=Mycobacterium sp. TaxID=1785 RepID=UPI0039C98872